MKQKNPVHLMKMLWKTAKLPNKKKGLFLDLFEGSFLFFSFIQIYT